MHFTSSCKPERGIQITKHTKKFWNENITSYETMAFLEQDAVRWKYVVDDSVYSKYRILNISVGKFPMKFKKIFDKN